MRADVQVWKFVSSVYVCNGRQFSFHKSRTAQIWGTLGTRRKKTSSLDNLSFDNWTFFAQTAKTAGTNTWATNPHSVDQSAAGGQLRKWRQSVDKYAGDNSPLRRLFRSSRQLFKHHPPQTTPAQFFGAGQPRTRFAHLPLPPNSQTNRRGQSQKSNPRHTL